MFSRLFNLYLKKETLKGEPCQNWKSNLGSFQAQPSLPTLGESKIRVLVFRECVKKSDKTLLFDSDAIVVTSNDRCVGGYNKSVPTICKEPVEQPEKCLDGNLACSPPKYKRLKPSSDVKILGEMIFGSVPMIYKGSIQKVHLISTPPQLLMTKVFALRSRSAGVNFCDNEMSGYSLNATTPSLCIAGSMASKGANTCGKTRSHSNPNIKSHKRTFSNPTMQSKVRRNSEMSTWSWASDGQNDSFDSQCGSLQRRYARSMMTSFDSTDILRNKTELSEDNRAAYRQQPKIAVGIIFKLWEDDEQYNRLFQDFFFSHYSLFESHLQTFRVKIEKSFYLRKNFTDVVLKATETFKHDILSLCYSPRIVEPVWLNLMILQDEKHNEAVGNFVNTFIGVVKKVERKQNNFFLSTLLSAVLTHHPSWVATVTPSTNSAQRSYLDKHSSSELDVLARCHPYNPLWAQLCDMYGSTNSPRQLARTIIVGENANLIVEMLYLLTYFLRCSNINENDLKIEYPPHTSEPTGCESDVSYDNYTWKEAMFDQSGSDVHSWIDNISCVGASETVKDSYISPTPGMNARDPRSCESLNTSTCPDDDNESAYVDQLESSRCYCSYLETLQCNTGRRNIMNVIKGANREKVGSLLTSIRTKQSATSNSFCGNMNTSSATFSRTCRGCKGMNRNCLSKFCDACDQLLRNINLDFGSTCSYCVVQLERLNDLVHSRSHKDGWLCNGVCDSENDFSTLALPTSSSTSRRKSRNTYCVRSDGLPCVCFPCTTNNNEAHRDDGQCDDISCITSPRKLSHSLGCIQSPDMNGKVLRHSTTSHDSGAEMACSVTSSCPEMETADSMNLTRDSSMSSRDNLFSSDTITGDLDSDYCSVENEQTSVQSEVTFGSDLRNTVCKSTSSTTIKEVYMDLDSSTMNTIIDTSDESCQLDTELDSLNFKKVPLPSVKSAAGLYLSTFGSSLLAGYCEEYVPDFVLHGTRKLNEEKLATDLQNSVKHSILDEQVYDASCVVANTDTWTCEVWNLSRRPDAIDNNTSESLTRKPVAASSLVTNMIESTRQLYDMEMPPKFCLLHLEEQLKDIYHRSRVLTEYARINTKLESSALPKSLSFRASDMELMNAVCTAQASPLAESSL